MRIVSMTSATLLFILLNLTFSIQASANSDCWAVLLEMNDFPVGWSDLPVGYINTQRIQAALLDIGWQNDHMNIVNGNLTLSSVQEAVDWLKNNAGQDDTILLYIFTHGGWMRNTLLWNSWFPSEWKLLNSSKRILMIDTCYAEEFLNLVKDDPSPHISLGCCSEDEVSWAGLEEEGLPIIGSVWNYYFTNALTNSSADLDQDGLVSLEEAFNFSKPLLQRYMEETVFTVPEFLDMYHNIGIYPEYLDAYPHPVMDDQYSNQIVIPEFQTLATLSFFMIATLFTALTYRRKPV